MTSPGERRIVVPSTVYDFGWGDGLAAAAGGPGAAAVHAPLPGLPRRLGRYGRLPLLADAVAGAPRCRGTSCLHRLRPQALLGLPLLRGSPLHRMVWCRPDATYNATQGCSSRGRRAHSSVRLARAQGCPAPQAGGHILALGTAAWGWAGLGGCELGVQAGRPMCPVGGACIPTNHSAPACPGRGSCGCLWVRGTDISLPSCRSLNRLGWARSRAIPVALVTRRADNEGNRDCLAAARARSACGPPHINESAATHSRCWGVSAAVGSSSAERERERERERE